MFLKTTNPSCGKKASCPSCQSPGTWERIVAFRHRNGCLYVAVMDGKGGLDIFTEDCRESDLFCAIPPWILDRLGTWLAGIRPGEKVEIAAGAA
ncbi:MAG: hypothetical protein H6Q00_2125 [Holophagaceae bacterium]|uniref:hypothetical protein n=1 Tax=Holophaga foetida TaxID=35839 RepID=UPI0002472177|nr:hypothetical protein [Holophaga foetida]MBP1627650.1 hypothetical protein [Holophagaceae bacterium]